MSGFEIVGLIGAIPGVVQLVTQSISLIHKCASSSKLSCVHKGADLQLAAIQDLLTALDGRCKDSKRGLWLPDDIRNISRSVKELHAELEGLTKLLNSVALACTKGERRLFRRIRLLFSGYENQFKEQFQRIEAIKSLLTLILTNTINGHLEQAIEEPSKKRERYLLKVKTVLQPCNHDFIPPKSPGTLGWVLTHPHFANWMDPLSNDILNRGVCIYGVKGCGKSVLATSIVSDLRLRGSPVGLFSFWAQSESQRRTNHMLSTLAWDLISKLPDKSFDTISPAALSLYNPTTSDLFNLISTTIGLLDQTCFLIIDGLDEGAEDWNTDTGVLKQVSGLLNHHKSLRILLLGRETAVRVALKTFSGLEITKELVHDDIQKVVSEEILKLSNVKPELRDYIQEFLTNNSTAMFLWVKMVFKELQRCYNASEIKLALEHTPHNLEEEYDRLFSQLMKRIGGSSSASIGALRTRRLFQLVLGAMEPLSLDQLRHAYAASCSSGSEWEDHLLSDEGIIDTLGDFIYISKTRVYLGHASIAEYLTRELSVWPDNSNITFFQMTSKDINSWLAISCINYLQIVEWDSLMTSSTERNTEILNHYPFLSYSHLRVLFHFFESKNNMITEEMKSFINSAAFGCYIEYWLGDYQGGQTLNQMSRLLIFSEVTQLALWYDSVSHSKDEFFRILQTELKRRESTFGLDCARTTRFAEFLQIWDGMRELVDFHSGAFPEDHAIDETPVSRQQPKLVTKPSPTVVVPHQVPPQTAVGAVTRRAFDKHSTSGIIRFVLGLDVFKVNNWLPAPEDLVFEMLLRASPRLPVYAILWASIKYRSNEKLNKSKQLCNIAFLRCKGKCNFIEALCCTNMAAIEFMEDRSENAIEYLRKATRIYANMRSNIVLDIAKLKTSCRLIEELLQLEDEEADSEALKILEEQTVAFLPRDGKATTASRRKGGWINSSATANYNAGEFLDIVYALYNNGYHSKAVDLSSLMLGQTKVNDEDIILETKEIMGLSHFKLSNYTESAKLLKDWLVKRGPSEKSPGYSINVYCQTLHFMGETDQALEVLRTEIPKVASQDDLNLLHYRTADILMSQEKFVEAQEEIYKVDFLRDNSGLSGISTSNACHVFTWLHGKLERLGFTTRDKNNERLGAWLKNAIQVIQTPEEDLFLPSLCEIGQLAYSRGFPEWSLFLETMLSRIESDGRLDNLFYPKNELFVAGTLFRWAEAMYQDGHSANAEKLWSFCRDSETREIKSWCITEISKLIIKFEERGEFDRTCRLFRQLADTFEAMKPIWHTTFCDAWRYYHEGRSLFYENNIIGARSAYKKAISVSEDIGYESLALLVKAFGHRGLSELSNGKNEIELARKELLKTVGFCNEIISVLEFSAESSSLSENGGASSNPTKDADETNPESDPSDESPREPWIPKFLDDLKVLTTETESCLELMEKETLRVNFNSWQWTTFPVWLHLPY